MRPGCVGRRLMNGTESHEPPAGEVTHLRRVGVKVRKERLTPNGFVAESCQSKQMVSKEQLCAAVDNESGLRSVVEAQPYSKPVPTAGLGGSGDSASGILHPLGI